jgi:phosphoglycerate dehydrogenase-like enzyme
VSIVLLEPIHPDALALLRAYGNVLVLDDPTDLAHVQGTPQVEAVITRGRGQIRRALIDALPELRVVARCGVGLDNVDVQAAAAHGIAVVYAPGSTTTAVAEHTLLLMLALARRLLPTANAVRSQQWAVRNGYQGMELAGKTLGIIGMGMIGRRVAQLASALGLSVIYWNRSTLLGPGQAVSLEELLRQADVISVHVALNPETRQLIGARQLAQMKPGALLINTARGAIVDQVAVAQALADGHLGGFAADVLNVEPPPADEPLVSQTNALLTPHIAALTTDTYRLMCVYTVTNVLAILRGEQPAPESLYH